MSDEANSPSPDSSAFHLERGIALNDAGRPQDAIASLNRALELNGRSAEAYNSRGIAYIKVGAHAQGLGDFTRAIELNPHYAKAYSNRASLHLALKRFDEALADSTRAVDLAPTSAAAHNNRASALHELKQCDAALASVDRALALNPGFAEAHANRGIILFVANRFEESVASCDNAIAIRPRLVKAHQCRGVALVSLRRFDEAAAVCDTVMDLDPTLKFGPGKKLYATMHCCRWDDFESESRKLLSGVSAGEPVTSPFTLLAIASSPLQQKMAAARFLAEEAPAVAATTWSAKPRQGRKLRIGYFSAHFHNHATSYLLAGLLEHHDRTQFEIYGFVFGHVPPDAMRQRLTPALDRLIDVDGMPDHVVARLARELEIDIAVDLMGFISGSRMGIFARGAAPLQVSYLGYPGTIHERYDYIIADPVVVPAENQAHFAEKIVQLPHSYQVNDSKRPIAERGFTRVELGLPDSAFVFCCFNNNYKITPDVFDVWMRLLQKVDGSVLWLLEETLLPL